MADTENHHPLKPTRPSVPEAAQPKSTESHPVPGGAHSRDDYEHDATVAHEQSDVNIRAIAAFVIALFAIGIVIHLALWGLLGLYQSRAIAADPAVSPLVAPSGTLPPEPRLLTNEPAALQQLRDEEDAALKQIDGAKRAVVGVLPAREAGRPVDGSPARKASRLDTSSGRRQ